MGAGAPHLQHLLSPRTQQEMNQRAQPPQDLPVNPVRDRIQMRQRYPRSSTTERAQGRAGWLASQPGLSPPLHSWTSLDLNPEHPPAMLTPALARRLGKMAFQSPASIPPLSACLHGSLEIISSDLGYV